MTMKARWVELLKTGISTTVLMFGALAFAEQTENPYPEPQFDLTSVQIGAIVVAQGSGLSESGILNYKPSYRLNSRCSVGIELGFTYLKLDDATKFSAFGYLADVDYRLSSNFLASLRAGAQTWTCTDCGTKLAIGPEFVYEFSNSPAGLIKNIWLSYLSVFQATVAHEFSAGVGFSFGGTK